VDHGARSDTELIALAQQGWASALGALLHRHGHTVAEIVRTADDPDSAVVETFTDVMRELDAAPEDVAGWLRTVASRHAGTAEASTAPRSGEAAPPIDLDAAWSRLATRWPRGRSEPTLPPALAWTAAVLATVALGAGVPWLTLGPLGDEPELHQLRAFPIDDDRDPVDTQASVDEDEEQDEPLPTYQFPVPPADRVEPRDAGADDPPQDTDSTDAVDPPPTSEPDGADEDATSEPGADEDVTSEPGADDGADDPADEEPA
jgi:hypothetical protein